EGVARFEGVPDGYVRLCAVADGPRRGETVVRIPRRDDAPAPLRLEEARDVAVEVLEAETGRPLEGVRIFPYRETGWAADEPFPVAPTDAKGRTTVRAVPAGTVIGLNAAGNGWI